MGPSSDFRSTVGTHPSSHDRRQVWTEQTVQSELSTHDAIMGLPTRPVAFDDGTGRKWTMDNERQRYARPIDGPPDDLHVSDAPIGMIVSAITTPSRWAFDRCPRIHPTGTRTNIGDESNQWEHSRLIGNQWLYSSNGVLAK